MSLLPATLHRGPRIWLRRAVISLVGALTVTALSVPEPPGPAAQDRATETRRAAATSPQRAAAAGRRYPRHTNIVATTFWVGEVFDPDAEDGSQMLSTYDDHWYRNYGGCDGRIKKGVCHTERRLARNGFFPRRMTPRQNPFYLDLPYDDLNDPIGFRNRGTVIPWAHTRRNKPYIKDPRVSLMKDRWVRIARAGRVCYGQIQDAGPGRYHDAKYVFGKRNARPANRRYNRAGMDVSPALNGCLGFKELNGQSDRVTWRFVDARDVPKGPWTRLVTRTPRPAPLRTR